MPQRLRFQALAFVASFLAFCLELAAAKLLLPRFGGAAYVWTGAMIFFQSLILLGYLYGRWAPFHPRAHAAMLAVPFFFLPLALPSTLPTSGPFGALFWALLRSVGAPFFALSTTVVVAQSWLMRSALPERRDGYFLYAASNAGAACALLAYPFVIGPLLTPSAEGWLWRGLYAAYAALCLSCAPRGLTPAGRPAAEGLAPSPRERALWLLLSAAPCAALISVTSFLSMDFAAVPLLWTVPLAAYLLTLVLNFKRHPWYPSVTDKTTLSLGAATLLISAGLAFRFSQDSNPAQNFARLLDLGKFAYALFALFALSMIFHKSLADRRPASERAMTEYYSWIASGGLFGSVLVGLAVPWLGRGSGATALDWAAVGALALAAIVARDWEQIAVYRKTSGALAALALVTTAAVAAAGNRTGTLYSLRNFYGVYSVQDRDGIRWFFHGNTEHGMQYLDPARQSEPLSYYCRASPLGDAWDALGAGWNSVGVVGLGAGSIAAYGRPGMFLDFYELDPDVTAIARRWFTHLRLSPAQIRVVDGDGRLSLERADGAAYDAIILDAFNSGSIPVHLVTKEAFAIYLSRLKPGGVILLQVSNRYLELRPMLAATARDLGLFGASKRQSFGPGEEGRTGSVWVAMGRDAASIDKLVRTKTWSAFDESGPRSAAWTDRQSSLLLALSF
ncbi:MAG: fused MFS/spermidine synthase [Elusimicrobiota bacterium]